ncbi:MAG TPA: lysoplasmalogenase [Chitinophagaceae bacterium]|jgi:uncharacterized membrane protein YhhN|nr:lysoplasmalogenase [Chitinophagaceae bacterium]
MKHTYWVILFLIVLLANILGSVFNNTLLQNISKPLLMPLLMGWFLFSGIRNITNRKWILAALFFSWLGDVLLMFQEKDALFFMLGLAAFLIAHIFYIIFFFEINRKEKSKLNLFIIIAVVAYYIGLLTILFPTLGEMKIPVIVYGLVISIMLLSALHLPITKNREASIGLMMGAVLFVISDSVLAINKFYRPFEYSGVLIMLTYGLAQWFIVNGAILYLRNKNE